MPSEVLLVAAVAALLAILTVAYIIWKNKQNDPLAKAEAEAIADTKNAGSAPLPKGNCKGNTDCTDGAFCVDGTCVKFKPSCYTWFGWEAAKHTGGPTGIAGGVPGSGIIPVAAKVNGVWRVGITPTTPGDPAYHKLKTPAGVFTPDGGMLYGAMPSGLCPMDLRAAEDISEALTVGDAAQGLVPICWDFSGVSGAFVPYFGGSCQGWQGMGSFKLVAGTV